MELDRWHILLPRARLVHGEAGSVPRTAEFGTDRVHLGGTTTGNSRSGGGGSTMADLTTAPVDLALAQVDPASMDAASAPVDLVFVQANLAMASSTMVARGDGGTHGGGGVDTTAVGLELCMTLDGLNVGP